MGFRRLGVRLIGGGTASWDLTSHRQPRIGESRMAADLETIHNGVLGINSCLVALCLSTNPQGQSEVLAEAFRNNRPRRTLSNLAVSR